MAPGAVGYKNEGEASGSAAIKCKIRKVSNNKNFKIRVRPGMRNVVPGLLLCNRKLSS